jgi:hypothetical protein
MCPGVEGVAFISGDLAPDASAVEERSSAEEKPGELQVSGL